MYTIYVKFRCLPNKREAFIQKVKDTGVLAAILADDGCIKISHRGMISPGFSTV